MEDVAPLLPLDLRLFYALASLHPGAATPGKVVWDGRGVRIGVRGG
jgi:hypothetical protein